MYVKFIWRRWLCKQLSLSAHIGAGCWGARTVFKFDLQTFFTVNKALTYKMSHRAAPSESSAPRINLFSSFAFSFQWRNRSTHIEFIHFARSLLRSLTHSPSTPIKSSLVCSKQQLNSHLFFFHYSFPSLSWALWILILSVSSSAARSG